MATLSNNDHVQGQSENKSSGSWSKICWTIGVVGVVVFVVFIGWGAIHASKQHYDHKTHRPFQHPNPFTGRVAGASPTVQNREREGYFDPTTTLSEGGKGSQTMVQKMRQPVCTCHGMLYDGSAGNPDTVRNCYAHPPSAPVGEAAPAGFCLWQSYSLSPEEEKLRSERWPMV